jgi:hypothetical protein
MKKSVFTSILVVLIGGSLASSVIADDTLVRFKGAIGDIPPANVAGTANPDGSFPDVIRNIVRGVNPAGRLGDLDFRADVKTDGRISLDGGCCWAEAMPLAPTATPASSATLTCESGAFIQHSTSYGCSAGGQR